MKIKLISFCRRHRELLVYCIVGALTTLVNWVVYYVLTGPVGMHYTIVNVIAWIVSVAFAFVANKRYVFQNEEREKEAVLRQALRFVLSRLGTLAAEELILFIGADLLKLDPDIVKIPANLVVIILNYILSKFLVF